MIKAAWDHFLRKLLELLDMKYKKVHKHECVDIRDKEKYISQAKK